MVYNYTHDQN